MRIVGVIKGTPLGGTATVFYFSINGISNTRAGLFSARTADGVFSGSRRLDADAGAFAGSAGSASSFCVASTKHSFSAGFGYAYKNVSSSASVALSGSSNTSNTDSAAVALGGTSSGANVFTGDIGIILAFDSALTDPLSLRLHHSAAFSFKIQCS